MKRSNRTRVAKLKSLLATALIFLLILGGTLNYSGAIYAISFNQELVPEQPGLGLVGDFLKMLDDMLRRLGLYPKKGGQEKDPVEEPLPGEGPGPGKDPAAEPAGPGEEPVTEPGSDPGGKSGKDPGEESGKGPGKAPGKDPGKGSGNEPGNEPPRGGEGAKPAGEEESLPGEDGAPEYQWVYGTAPLGNPYIFPQLPERGGFVVFANSFDRAYNFLHSRLKGQETSTLPEQTMSRLSMRNVKGMAGFYMAKNLTINGKPYHFFVTTSGGNEELTISGKLVLHVSEMAFARLDAIILVLDIPVTKMWFLEPWNSLLVNVAGIGNTVGTGREVFFNAHYMEVERITIPNLELNFKEGHHTSYTSFEFRELIIQ